MGQGTKADGARRFSGRQLATMVCIASVSLVLIPTAALAAVGSFSSSNNLTPGVTGTNVSPLPAASGVFGNATGAGNNTRFGVYGRALGTAGVGVQGAGAKYGVYSAGPLGVAAGKTLSCTACVTPGDLSAAAVASTAPTVYTTGLVLGETRTIHLTGNAGYIRVGTLTVPAGSYVVNASVELTNLSTDNSPQPVVCILELGGNDFPNDNSQVASGMAQGAALSQSLTVAGNIAGASEASLDCAANTPDTNALINIQDFEMNAIKVGTVVHQ